MEKLYTEGASNGEPTTILYNTVINAWAKSYEQSIGQRSEHLLEKNGEAVYEW